MEPQRNTQTPPRA